MKFWLLMMPSLVPKLTVPPRMAVVLLLLPMPKPAEEIMPDATVSTVLSSRSRVGCQLFTYVVRRVPLFIPVPLPALSSSGPMCSEFIEKLLRA